MKWEHIDNYHQRCAIPGGWLVKAYEPVVHNMFETGQGMAEGWDWRVAMCFVPDPEHAWKLDLT